MSIINSLTPRSLRRQSSESRIARLMVIDTAISTLDAALGHGTFKRARVNLLLLREKISTIRSEETACALMNQVRIIATGGEHVAEFSRKYREGELTTLTQAPHDYQKLAHELLNYNPHSSPEGEQDLSSLLLLHQMALMMGV